MLTVWLRFDRMHRNEFSTSVLSHLVGLVGYARATVSQRDKQDGVFDMTCSRVKIP